MMNASQPQQSAHRGERGFVLAAGAILLAAIFAMMVVAIDIGRISHTGTELQGVADSAAVSGAMNVLKLGAGNANTGATAAASDNSYDGQGFVNGSHGRLTTTEGNWNPANSPPFTPGGAPTNAVNAFVTGPNVVRILAPLVGDSSTMNIYRQAVAVIAPPSSAQATLPLALCSDVSNGVNPQPPGPCANGDGTVIKALPDIQQQGAQNSCFTGIDGQHSASNERNLLPTACGGTPATAVVGENISLDNGQQNSVLKAIHDCVSNVHKFVLPVIGNCRCSGTTQPVVGFVEIQIDDPSQVITQGGNKRITGAKQICDNGITNDAISTEGAGDFGIKEVRLVQ